MLLSRVIRELDQDELIDRWTLIGKEPGLVATKRGAVKIEFALMLRFYTEKGQFPRGRSEIHDDAVEYVPRQIVSTGPRSPSMTSPAARRFGTESLPCVLRRRFAACNHVGSPTEPEGKRSLPCGSYQSLLDFVHMISCCRA